MILIGRPIIFTHEHNSYDPVQGAVEQKVYEGTEAGVRGIAEAVKKTGGSCSWGPASPGSARWVITTTYNSRTDGGEETPQEIWNVQIEPYQVSVWSHPRVAARMAALDAQNIPGSRGADWRKTIEDAAQDKAQLPTGTLNPGAGNYAADPIALAVWRDLLRGQEAVELKAPVLVRNRTYGTRFTKRARLWAIERVYSTSALVATFNIPTDVQARLPEDPDDVPAGAVWSWKSRRSETTMIRNTGRVDEFSDWVFAAWSTTYYDYIRPGVKMTDEW